VFFDIKAKTLSSLLRLKTEIHIQKHDKQNRFKMKLGFLIRKNGYNVNGRNEKL